MKQKGIALVITALTLVVTSRAQIFVMDDFKGGDWAYEIGGTEKEVTHSVYNISSTLFGMRTVSIRVTDNFLQLPLGVQVGNGSFQVVRGGPETTWVSQVRYDDQTGHGVDMSYSDQIWIEGGDGWSTSNDARWGVIDIHGTARTSGSFIRGNGYFYVRKSSFSGIDWAHVSTFVFEVSSNNQMYSHFDTILLAPEPGVNVAFGGMLLGMGALAHRRRLRPGAPTRS